MKPEKGITTIYTNWGNTLEFAIGAAPLPTSAAMALTGGTPVGVTMAALLDYWPEGEPVYIRDIMCILPYQFGQGPVTPIMVQFEWLDRSANFGSLLQLGAGGNYIIPDVNVRFPVNTAIEYPSAAGAADDWQIRITNIQGNVNLLNTPADFLSTTQYFRIMLNITSTNLQIA